MPRGTWTGAYIASVAFINWLFVVVPPVSLLGTTLPPAMLAVGFVFVLRDFSQREVGHRVLAAMLAGGAISYVMAAPAVAIASVSAFLLSEAVDWLVYTLTRRPLSQRILYSSALGVPVDTYVFLSLIGFGDTRTIALGSLVKMIAAVGFWWYLRRRERRAGADGSGRGCAGRGHPGSR